MKKNLAYLAVAVLVVTVAVFLGKHSIEFFTNTFSGEDSTYGVLGYMLTGGGFFLWLIIFMWKSETKLQKTVSFVMMITCLLGELGTSIFNMYMHTMSDAGFTLSESDIKSMYLLIGVLAIAHAASLVAEFAGESVIQAFRDDDKDGIPNIIDRKDNRQHSQQPRTTPANTPMTAKAADVEAVDPTTRPQ